MALVMFATSANISLDLHYCQGKLKSINWLGWSGNCCQPAENTSTKVCVSHQEMNNDLDETFISRTKCCDDKPTLLQSDLDQNNEVADDKIAPELKRFVVAYVAIFLQKDFTQKSATRFFHYDSPFIARDTYVLFQSFLI